MTFLHGRILCWLKHIKSKRNGKKSRALILCLHYHTWNHLVCEWRWNHTLPLPSLFSSSLMSFSSVLLKSFVRFHLGCFSCLPRLFIYLYFWLPLYSSLLCHRRIQGPLLTNRLQSSDKRLSSYSRDWMGRSATTVLVDFLKCFHSGSATWTALDVPYFSKKLRMDIVEMESMTTWLDSCSSIQRFHTNRKFWLGKLLNFWGAGLSIDWLGLYRFWGIWVPNNKFRAVWNLDKVQEELDCFAASWAGRHQLLRRTRCLWTNWSFTVSPFPPALVETPWPNGR